MTETAKREAVVYTFTAPVRAGFLNVISAKAFKGKGGKEVGDPRYDASFILAKDSPDLKALQERVIPLLKAKFPGKKIVGRRLTQEELDGGNTVEVKTPWADGDKEADKAKAKGKDQEFFRGANVIKASSKFEPVLSVIEGGKVKEFSDPAVRPTLKKYFYAGAWFVPYVEINIYDAQDEKPAGANLRLKALLFVKNGERIGGAGVNAAEVFKGYAGSVSAEDPTVGAELDDEIPF